ncbi:Hpt domain-containing protein [Thaumasiovibrio sp. DFM-14]|uniref:Hpt domain-containing protein n=1 Tax=Thaumasiovibrio sp. DFM-14 TaxID=3384792 RepID=UPI0039A1A052
MVLTRHRLSAIRLINVLLACTLLVIPVALWQWYSASRLENQYNQLNTLNIYRAELMRSVILMPAQGERTVESIINQSSSFRRHLLTLPDDIGQDHELGVSLKLGGSQFVDLVDIVLAGGYAVSDLANELSAAYQQSETEEVRAVLDHLSGFFFREVFASTDKRISVDNQRYRQFIATIEQNIQRLSLTQRAEFKSIIKMLSPMVARHGQYDSSAQKVIDHHFNNQLPAVLDEVFIELRKSNQTVMATWLVGLSLALSGFIYLFISSNSLRNVKRDVSQVDDAEVVLNQDEQTSSVVTQPAEPSAESDTGESASVMFNYSDAAPSSRKASPDSVDLSLANSASVVQEGMVSGKADITHRQTEVDNRELYQILPEEGHSFDINIMLDALDDDTDAVNMLLQLFISEHGEDAQRLSQLSSEGQEEQLRLLVHTIKGVTGSLGANSVAEMAAEVERQLKADMPIQQPIQELANRLNRLLEEVRLHLEVGVSGK